MKDTRFAKMVLFVNASVPLALLLWDVFHKQVGVNPVEFVTRTTGMLTLVFLMISLAVTPLRRITGANWLVKFRRMLGLYAFFYGFLHLMTYVWFDRFFNLKSIPGDDHQHAPNRFAVIPTSTRLEADPGYTGKGVTIAFLDSGFYPHPDLIEPTNRIIAYKDLSNEKPCLQPAGQSESWQWHGTQTSVSAAGNGYLGDGVYRGLAHESNLVLVKVSEKGQITEENIARGIKWVIENRERYQIRVLNISLGGDEDVPCSRSIIDQAAEEAISQGIVVVAAAGNSGAEGLHSIPPANSPSVITVGGYSDHNQPNGNGLDLYHSNFGVTADGTVKPEIVAPAMWVAAPILPGTSFFERAEALSVLASAPDYQLPGLARELEEKAELPENLSFSDPRRFAGSLKML